MSKIAIILSLMLLGCGHPQDFDMDLEVNPIVDRFWQDAKKFGAKPDFKALSVRIVPYDNKYLGVCFTIPQSGVDGNGTYRTWLKHDIVLNANYWSKMKKMTKYALVYHELAHCTMHKEHTDELIVFPDGKKHEKSLMYPYNIAYYDSQIAFVGPYWGFYIKELFTGKVDFSYHEIFN